MIGSFFRRVSDVLYDVTVGLLQQYKKTTIELAKIELAGYYVRLVKFVRQECMYSTLAIFGVVIFANALGVIQMGILLYAPWAIPYRILAALSLGLVAALLPLMFVMRLFSEERWMEITKANRFVDRAMQNGDGAFARSAEHETGVDA